MSFSSFVRVIKQGESQRQLGHLYVFFHLGKRSKKQNETNILWTTSAPGWSVISIEQVSKQEQRQQTKEIITRTNRTAAAATTTTTTAAATGTISYTCETHIRSIKLFLYHQPAVCDFIVRHLHDVISQIPPHHFTVAVVYLRMQNWKVEPVLIVTELTEQIRCMYPGALTKRFCRVLQLAKQSSTYFLFPGIILPYLV